MSTPYRGGLAALRAQKAALEADLERAHQRRAEGSRALESARVVERELLDALEHLATHGPLHPMEMLRPRWTPGQLIAVSLLAFVLLVGVGLLLVGSVAT